MAQPLMPPGTQTSVPIETTRSALTPTVATPGRCHAMMVDRHYKANSLLGGTDAMRAAGQTFLPQYSGESDNNYRNRLRRATLFNYFKKTVDTLSAKPFQEKLQIRGLDPRLGAIVDDADLQGNNLHVFCHTAFLTGVAKGLALILTDYPVVEATSAAEEMALAPRPYFVSIPPESVLAAYATYEGGRERIVHFRYYTCEVVRSGWGEEEIERIVVWEVDAQQLVVTTWRKYGKGWKVEGVREIPAMDEVPLSVFYTEREELLVSRPPLLDLEDKNIEHWQSASDQRHILTVTRFPMLAGQGVTAKEAGTLTVGPYEILMAENPAAKFYYVEHTGAAVNAGRTDLQDLKAEMAALAFDMLAPRPGRLTATEKNIDANEGDSIMEGLALRFEDAIERAFVFAGTWVGIPPEDCGSVELFTNFSLDPSNAAQLQALLKAREAGDLAARDLIDEFVRRGMLDPERIAETLRILNQTPSVQEAQTQQAGKA